MAANREILLCIRGLGISQASLAAPCGASPPQAGGSRTAGASAESPTAAGGVQRSRRRPPPKNLIESALDVLFRRVHTEKLDSFAFEFFFYGFYYRADNIHFAVVNVGNENEICFRPCGVSELVAVFSAACYGRDYRIKAAGNVFFQKNHYFFLNRLICNYLTTCHKLFPFSKFAPRTAQKSEQNFSCFRPSEGLRFCFSHAFSLS